MTSYNAASSSQHVALISTIMSFKTASKCKPFQSSEIIISY